MFKSAFIQLGIFSDRQVTCCLICFKPINRRFHRWTQISRKTRMRPVHLCQSASSAVQFPLFISENKRYTVTFQSNQRDPETYAFIGAAIEVHMELGNGFLEAVCQDALEKELALRCIPFVREQSIPILYKGKTLSTPIAPISSASNASSSNSRL